MKILSLILLSIPFVATAVAPSFEIHRTQLDKKVKTCPSDAMTLAEEILSLELSGLRWQKTKPSCFESLKMKYVHAIKHPDAKALEMVPVKRGSLTIDKPKYNEEFYSYDVGFTVENEKGETVKDSISFMTNADLGKAKPEEGCALISSSPKSAYVYGDCL